MRVLIVGCGGQGCLSDVPTSENSHKVISFAHAFKEAGVELAFFDTCNRKAIDAMEVWGGTATTIRYACDNIGVDIVVVTTPDNTHYEVLKEIIRYKHPRLVISEKPLCNTYQEAKEIVNIYKACGIPLLVNYTRRFIPELRELKQRYEAGEFGDIIGASLDFNRGLEHTGTHMIDFMIWFFGEEIARKFKYHETKNCYNYRIWQIQLFFEKFFFQEQRIFDMPVPSYLDFGTRHVVNNAMAFLEGKEELFCTANDALESLRIIKNLR